MREDFGVMEYESIAPDFNTRIMWPVYLKYDGGRWNSTTNGWREWAWEGNEPLNLRLGRFVSIVELSRVYNMTFESEPPIDMRLQFQRRKLEGDNSEFVVIKLHYPRPNSIRVQNRGVTQKPITLRDNNGETALDTTVCGSNKFFYQNNTIHFVLTGHPNCQVRVSLTNSIQLTARFNMDVNKFYDIDGQTKFIDRICAILNINDTSRLKVVGVYTGSTVVTAYIEETPSSPENAQNHDNNAGATEMENINEALNDAYSTGALGSAFPASEGFGELTDFETEVYTHEEDSVVAEA